MRKKCKPTMPSIGNGKGKSVNQSVNRAVVGVNHVNQCKPITSLHENPHKSRQYKSCKPCKPIYKEDRYIKGNIPLLPLLPLCDVNIRVRARGRSEEGMSEKELEKMFRTAVREAGGCAYKFVSPGMSGVPDRLVVLPGNAIGFVELKAPGKKSRPEQCYQQRRLRGLGCYVTVLDAPEMIGQIIREIIAWRDTASGHGASSDLMLGGIVELLKAGGRV